MSRSAEALWRAIAVFRFASLGYAALLLGAINNDRYSRPDLAWAALGVMLAWTIGTTLAYSHRRHRTPALLTADLVVTAGLLLSNYALQYPAARHTGVVPVTATWIAGPVLAWAVRYGRVAGVAAALALSVCNLALTDLTFTVVPNGEVLMILAGVAVGHVARLAAELESERQHADRVEAASRERERLARNIHDSVLQVLALVQRRGLEAGGEAAEIGRLAGQQEVALRALIGAAAIPGEGTPPPRGQPPGSPAPAGHRWPDSGEVDLNALLLPLATDRVTVGGPAGSVLVKERAGEEVVAAVRAALDNVRRHCGAKGRAWVLVEDEPDVVTVTIRDDGPGIPEGRLAEAAEAGRLGVSQSICGRLRDVGGSASVTCVPGEGTEVTLRLPRARGSQPRPRESPPPGGEAVRVPT